MSHNLNKISFILNGVYLQHFQNQLNENICGEWSIFNWNILVHQWIFHNAKRKMLMVIIVAFNAKYLRFIPVINNCCWPVYLFAPYVALIWYRTCHLTFIQCAIEWDWLELRWYQLVKSNSWLIHSLYRCLLFSVLFL